MDFSYSGDPSKSDVDQVRFLVGDTNVKKAQLGDKEIEFLVGLEGSVLKAASKAAESIAAKVAGMVDQAAGKVRVSLSDKYKHYTDLAKRLRLDAAKKTICPFAGGLSKTQKEVEANNDDRVEPSFTRDLRHPFCPLRTQSRFRLVFFRSQPFQ